MAQASPGEVLVRDLVAGSGLAFEDRGEHELKGIPMRGYLLRGSASLEPLGWMRPRRHELLSAGDSASV